MNGPSLRAVAAISCGIGLVFGAGLVLIFVPRPIQEAPATSQRESNCAEEPVESGAGESQQRPADDLPKPKGVVAAAPGNYEALQAFFEGRIPGLIFMNRAGGAPGMMYSDADGKFGIVVASDDPVGTERALERDGKPGWKLCRWGKFHFVGQPEVIDSIAKTADVAAREIVMPAPPVMAKDPVPGPGNKKTPQPPEQPPAEPRIIPPAVAALIERTKSKDAKDRIAALKDVAVLGPGAEDACRAVCLCLLDTRREVAREALHALEKIHTDVYEPVKTLMVDNNGQRHADALAQLAALRDRGSGAAPIILAYIRSTMARGGQPLEQSLAHQAQVALLDVARDDGEIVDDLLKIVRNLSNTALSATAYRHLGYIGRAHPQLAKRITAQCRIGLKREANVVEPIAALGRIGPPAAEVIPDLQRIFDGHPNGEVRDQAGDALKRIQTVGGR